MAMSDPTKEILERAVLAAQTYAESFPESVWVKSSPIVNLRDLFMEGLRMAFEIELGHRAAMPTTLIDTWR